MNIPVGPGWFLTCTSGRIFGHINLNECRADEELKKSKLPVLIFHGTGDQYVPCQMSEVLKKNDPDMVELEIFPGAAHGTSYISDPVRYERALDAFMKRTSGFAASTFSGSAPRHTRESAALPPCDTPSDIRRAGTRADRRTS